MDITTCWSSTITRWFSVYSESIRRKQANSSCYIVKPLQSETLILQCKENPAALSGAEAPAVPCGVHNWPCSLWGRHGRMILSPLLQNNTAANKRVYEDTEAHCWTTISFEKMQWRALCILEEDDFEQIGDACYGCRRETFNQIWVENWQILEKKNG